MVYFQRIALILENKIFNSVLQWTPLSLGRCRDWTRSSVEIVTELNSENLPDIEKSPVVGGERVPHFLALGQRIPRGILRAARCSGWRFLFPLVESSSLSPRGDRSHGSAPGTPVELRMQGGLLPHGNPPAQAEFAAPAYDQPRSS
jgi:hypothetical protein